MARSLAAVLGLVPMVLFLHGCGGGGGDGKPCTNEKLKLVSQSVDLEGSFEVQMPMPNATDAMKQSIPLSIVEKLDMEYMKWYVGYDVKAEIPDPMTPANPMKQMDMSVKAMMDVGKKMIAFAIRSHLPGVPGGQLNNCSYLKVSWLGAPEAVASCVKDAFDKEGMAPPEVPGLNIEGPTCRQFEDGFDTWTLKFQNETMIAPGKTEMLSVEESFKMDKDFLFREMSATVEVGKVATVFGSLKSKGTPKQVGPSDEDLDYTKWGMGNCTEIPLNFPPQMEHVFLALSAKPGAGKIIPFLMKHRDTIEKAAAAEGRRLAGAGPIPDIPGGIPAMAKCFLPGAIPPAAAVVTV